MYDDLVTEKNVLLGLWQYFFDIDVSDDVLYSTAKTLSLSGELARLQSVLDKLVHNEPLV